MCLSSVIAATNTIKAEFFVIDNASTDGSKDFFTNKFSSVQFVWNEENVGFGAANNQVLKDCKGDYILFLNPDTILPEDFFKRLFSEIDSLADVGTIGVRMIDGEGKFLPESKRSLPSLLSTFYKMTGLANLFPRNVKIASYYAGAVGENEKGKVQILSGACMLLSSKAAKATNGFDEDFFMYGEDIDLSYRVLKAGLANYYVPLTIVHYKGESTSKSSDSYYKNFYGAMKLFVKKHYNQIYAASLKPVITVVEKAAVLKRKLKGKDKESSATQENNWLMLTEIKLPKNYTPVKDHDAIAEKFYSIVEQPRPLNDRTEVLREWLIKKKVKIVILGDDRFSYKTIIEIIEMLSGIEKIYVLATATNSLVYGGNSLENGLAVSVR